MNAWMSNLTLHNNVALDYLFDSWQIYKIENRAALAADGDYLDVII